MKQTPSMYLPCPSKIIPHAILLLDIILKNLLNKIVNKYEIESDKFANFAQYNYRHQETQPHP